jgi:hypothetical protein
MKSQWDLEISSGMLVSRRSHRVLASVRKVCVLDYQVLQPCSRRVGRVTLIYFVLGGADSSNSTL